MVLDTAEILIDESAQPYTCPVEKCSRSYKTVQGLQLHLKQLKGHDRHGQGTPATPQATATPKNKKSKHRNKSVKVKLAQTPTVQVPEPLTFEEAQKMVQLDVNGIVVRIGINDALNVVTCNSSAVVPEDDLDPAPVQSNPILLTPKLLPLPDLSSKTVIPLPEASFCHLPHYTVSDAPPRPNAYIRFIEKSAEELDGEVEYDVDEEDSAWLTIMNKRREAVGLAPVAVDSLELLMDRFEKESYFQATQVEDSGTPGSDNPHHRPISMDDDAVCCICMDGECQNTNVILFCDMCNLAVHQDCYGVPYIPEGQWLCRRCLQSPSRAVSCVLCPNQGGAFKQTDRGDWAHVVCALWIPEVRFANTVFLEPVDSVEAVPAARWRLTCVICRQKGVGACIQCHRTSCYAAFHVTCAQHYGLYMRMQTVPQSDISKVQIGLLTQSSMNQQPVLVQKIAYCEQHSPPDHQIVKKEPTNLPNNRKQNRNNAKRTKNNQLQQSAESGAPVILLPTIPPERIQEIGALVQIQKKSQFIQRLIAYWMLKRQFRNGVPLLRRLQSSSSNGGSCGGGHRGGGGASGMANSVNTNELYQQLKYWQCLRQDLERARLLCELVRKREKLKAELIRSTERCLNVQLHPLQSSLLNIILLISSKDTNDIFGEPVDPEEVPDYSTVVTDPMDLSTMKGKCEHGQYDDVASVEKDFELMISNCLKYNNRDTMFYRAGVRMREQGRAVLKVGKEELEKAGLLIKDMNEINIKQELKIEKKVVKKSRGEKSEDKLSEKPQQKVLSLIEDPLEVDKRLLILQDRRYDSQTNEKLEQTLKDVEALLFQCQGLKNGLARAKRVKLVRNEIVKVKRIQKERLEGKGEVDLATDLKKSDKGVKRDAEREPEAIKLKKDQEKLLDGSSKTSKSADKALYSLESSASSQIGVNRRTAVLFTRKGLNQSGGSSSSSSSGNVSVASKKAKGKSSSVKADGDEQGKEESDCNAQESVGKLVKDLQNHPKGTKRGSNRSDSTRSSTSAETSSKKLRRTNITTADITKSPKERDTSTERTASPTKASAITTSTSEILHTKKDIVTSAPAASVIPDSFRVYRDTSGSKKGDPKGDRKGSKRAGTRLGRVAAVGPRQIAPDGLLTSDDDDFDEDDEMMIDDDSDEDDACSSDGSSSVSTCYSHTLSELEDISNTPETQSTSIKPAKQQLPKSSAQSKLSALKPLQLVWAKCRGYPWYPALIIDPATPPGGVVHRGVPLPGPPSEVVALRTTVAANNPDKDLFLILFFDAKRTWQWLTQDKLEIMDLQVDEHKTNEPRKPTDRKAVKRAFQHALTYMKQVTEDVSTEVADHAKSTIETSAHLKSDGVKTHSIEEKSAVNATSAS